MKSITAYIQPFMQEKVVDALRIGKIHGVTIVQCEGFGRRISGQTSKYEDAAAELGYAPKVKIEVVCLDGQVEEIVRVIRDSAHTGRHGDGKIFVSDVGQAVDIRTGTEGESIL